MLKYFLKCRILYNKRLLLNKPGISDVLKAENTISKTCLLNNLRGTQKFYIFEFYKP